MFLSEPFLQQCGMASDSFHVGPFCRTGLHLLRFYQESFTDTLYRKREQEYLIGVCNLVCQCQHVVYEIGDKNGGHMHLEALFGIAYLVFRL